jgi:hypothetical protein
MKKDFLLKAIFVSLLLIVSIFVGTFIGNEISSALISVIRQWLYSFLSISQFEIAKYILSFSFLILGISASIFLLSKIIRTKMYRITSFATYFNMAAHYGYFFLFGLFSGMSYIFFVSIIIDVVL